MPSAETLAVETERLSISRSGVDAVRSVSLHVPYASVYCLVGPSNSGKSTLLHALATLLPITEGTARVVGVDVQAHPRQVHRWIGYVPDLPAFHHRLTVDETMSFSAAVYGVPTRGRARLISDLLELFDLSDTRNRPVGTLSRGTCQRLALARAMVHDPPLLLLDDPTAHLDGPSRLEFREVLGALQGLDKTVLLSTTTLVDLAPVCTHLGILQGGELLAEGPVDSLLRDTATSTRIHVRVADVEARHLAGQILSGHPACLAVKENDSALVVEFAGTETDRVELLRVLVQAEVPVTSFEEHSPLLDDAILRPHPVEASA